jgi:hypothetical protein
MGPTIKVLLALFILCLDQPGFMFMLGRPCLVAQLGFMVDLMNNNVNLALLMLYLHQTRSPVLIGTWRTTEKNSATTRHMTLSWLNN